MKRLINSLSIAGLVLAAGLLLYLFWPPNVTHAAFTGLPLNQPRVVNFRLKKEALDGKTRREKLDQMRDWLLYAVISDSGHSTKEIGEMLYDLPVVRQSYMHHVGNFEYGETRSRMIGDGEVVALVPGGDTTNRIDQLAYIADEQRKNTGEIPKSLLVFEYKLPPDETSDQSSAEITRREAIDGNELFTEKYGYFESRITSLDELKAFLAQVDDLVFAQPADDGLRLGGRKVKDHQYRGIGPEHIAAIWQSQNKNRTQGGDFNPGQKVLADTGFSLDPDYRYDEIKKFFEKLLVPLHDVSAGGLADPTLPKLYGYQPYPLQATRGPDAAEVSTALDRCDIEPFFHWIDDFRNTQPGVVDRIEQLITSFGTSKGQRRAKAMPLEEVLATGFGFQKARYDGDLQGTEVGMILFYTDLVAKLWDFDFKNSTPREIEDFKSEVEIRRHYMSPVYNKQLEEMRFARLWFGPDSKGYDVVNEGSNLVFARKATRLFAKSSQNFRLTGEVEPSAATASFINWWDAHYEEVARYEPEYERLNQIMKWSLLVSWLNRANKGNAMDFLRNVPVKPNPAYRFPDWVKKQPNLRFSKWDQIKFLDNGNACATTECLESLTSDNFSMAGEKSADWVLEGGVSLGGEEAFAERTFLSAESKVGELARRSALDYAPLKSGENTLEAIEGTGYEFANVAPDQMLITSTPKSGSMLRTSYGDLANAKFEHVLKSSANGFNVEARYAETSIGDLNIQRGTNGFDIGWQGRDLDMAQSLARQLSRGADPNAVLNDPLVDSAIKLGGDQSYLVKMRNSDTWMKFMAEEQPSEKIAEGWQARFADIENGTKPIDVAWWDPARVHDELGGTNILIRNTGTNGHIMEIANDLPVSGERIRIVSGNSSVEATLDRQTESVLVRYGDLPEQLQKNPGELQRALSGVELSPRNGILQVGEIGSFDDEALSGILGSNRYEEAAQRLARDPSEFTSSLERHLSEELKQTDELLATKDYQQLNTRLNTLMDLYGPRPELSIRRGIAQIKSGRLTSAARTFNESIIDGQVPNRELFFKEINERLRTGAMSGDSVIQVTDDGKNIALMCRVKKLPLGQKVSYERVDLDSALVYVEDSPGLNNLDWSADTHAAMKEVISGELGDVIELPRGDLAKFRPTTIYAEDTGKAFHSARETTTTFHFRFPVTAGANLKCGNDQEEAGGCGKTYLVVSRTRSRN